MFGSTVLEIGIGLGFVYLLLSLSCTALNEGMARMFNMRGRNLFKGIKNLLNDPEFTGLAQQIYTHGLVVGISQHATNPKKPNRLPSYMSSATFALVLLDILGSKGAGEQGSWQSVVEHREKELARLHAMLNAAPDDSRLREKAVGAQAALGEAKQQMANALEKAEAVKRAHADAAEEAAKVTGPAAMGLLQDASQKLEKALAMGRALAASHPDPLGNIQYAISKLPDGHTKESLFVLVDQTKRETALLSDEGVAPEAMVRTLRTNVEQWFDSAMDRISGWYKRWTQTCLLIISMILISTINADTILLTKRFAQDSVLRASILMLAEKATLDVDGNSAAGGVDPQKLADLMAESQELGLPLGWVSDDGVYSEPNLFKRPWENQIPWLSWLGHWALKLFGLLLTVLAVSLGAPFWFDTLNKFMNIRSTGRSPKEMLKEAPQTPGALR